MMVGLYQISLSIYRSNPVCEGTNDRPVAALRAAPRRMFIFDASSLAPLGSRRPSAGASRPRMFGSQARVSLVVREWTVLSISATSPSPAAHRSDQRSSAITERREGGCRNLFSGCPLLDTEVQVFMCARTEPPNTYIHTVSATHGRPTACILTAISQR